MTYKAKSLSGAQRLVRSLLKQREEASVRALTLYDTVESLKAERTTLAKLAAEGPCFFSPLVVAEAKNLRDRVLRECGLMPDGKFIQAAKSA